ncbi:hypothetical protein L2E82_01179 [Cichorium intybus]|uniref:Uncharacterized protein n=1 Tax=Cichorium intybus TaxID=13427 RepID=A0ACB9GYZ6_CICIN|nr:hypothetical protein L2E82_01179 [Cichorium intybus]
MIVSNEWTRDSYEFDNYVHILLIADGRRVWMSEHQIQNAKGRSSLLQTRFQDLQNVLEKSFKMAMATTLSNPKQNGTGPFLSFCLSVKVGPSLACGYAVVIKLPKLTP